MKIIPAIDIMDGKCVRLSEGNFNASKMYYEDPLEVARMFEANGLKHLHMVDLDGARAGHVIHHRILEKITAQTSLQVDFGGGVQSDQDIRIAFDSGASQITAGSVVIKNEPLFLEWLNRYGAEDIILGADCRNGLVATNGWLNTSGFAVVEFIKKYTNLGITRVISTDIAKDGMLQGPSLELYKAVLKECKVDLIASGGISSIRDLIALKELGCKGAIIGKAIYEGTITLNELKDLC